MTLQLPDILGIFFFVGDMRLNHMNVASISDIILFYFNFILYFIL